MHYACIIKNYVLLLHHQTRTIKYFSIMAYISTEQVKEIRQNLKKEFPNLKFSVKRLYYSKVQVSILSGNIDFGTTYKNCTHETDGVFGKINQIVNKGNFNNSDSMTDYFHVGFYTEISIGRWDYSYVLKK